MIPAWSQLANLGAALAFILALKALSSPKTARLGNRIGAVGAIAAVAIVFFSESNLKHLPLILIAVAFGTIVGFVAAKKVQMTQMPQMVALFNGVGGGAAMAVSSIEFLKAGATDGFVALFATVFTVVIGSISFTGSIVTFLKLQELMTSRPVVLPLGRFITIGTALATLVMSVYLMIFPEIWALWTLVALSLVMGILFVLPVGGADVPIVISLLNAFTGLSVAASGYVLDNVLLLLQELWWELLEHC
jgi:H+-translocating NAD(P) transhydrogenase subunit beta